MLTVCKRGRGACRGPCRDRGPRPVNRRVRERGGRPEGAGACRPYRLRGAVPTGAYVSGGGLAVVRPRPRPYRNILPRRPSIAALSPGRPPYADICSAMLPDPGAFGGAAGRAARAGFAHVLRSGRCPAYAPRPRFDADLTFRADGPPFAAPRSDAGLTSQAAGGAPGSPFREPGEARPRHRSCIDFTQGRAGRLPAI